MEVFNEKLQQWMLYIQEQLIRLCQFGSQSLLRLRNRQDLLPFLLEDQVSSGIDNGEDQTNKGFNYSALLLEQEQQNQMKDIKFRWQICQPDGKKPTQSHQNKHMLSKTLVCSRPLFVERCNSRLGGAGNLGKESMLSSSEMGADYDDDLDSLSTTSELYTPAPTIIGHADQTKINALEQQLAALQKQMMQLLDAPTRDKTTSPSIVPTPFVPETCVIMSKTPSPPPPPPPPPAPPLLPSLKASLKANANSQSIKLKPLENKSDLDSMDTPIQSKNTKQQPVLTDILKDLGNVKLKRVNKSPDVGRKKKALELENDKSLAGALARALGERRKKLKTDSDDDGFEDDQTIKHDDSVDSWDIDKENVDQE